MMVEKRLIIPGAALAQHVICLGKTGSGKSSKMRVLVEGLLDVDRPVCIIDPKGDWWGIKSSADGKHAGYPVVIFGGEHADVPLNPLAGGAVAELIATGNRPALIDLGGWMVGERTRFFIDFASSLFKHARGARHLVIDEVHNFAPQGKVLDVDAGKCLHWTNRLASEGRGKGITLIAASQRPQKVHKDFLTSCETLIAGRVIHKLDRDAIKDWIDGCADPELGKQVLKELAGMKRTEAWVWSPEIEFGPERVTFPMFTTYDSFKPQGGEVKQLKGWAAVDLEDVKTKLAGVVAEAEANDPRKLRARIAELERQAKASPAPGASREDLQAAEQRGFAAGEQHAWREVEGRFKDLHAAVRETIEMTLRPPPAAAAAERSRKDPGSYPVKTPVSAGVKPSSARITKPLKRLSYDGNGAGEELTPGQRKVLAALLQYPAGLTREQLTVLAGYKRSTRDLYLQQLTRAGLVEYGNGKLIATFAGAAALPDAAPLPTGQELREHWLTKLPPGERKVLEVLIESYPQALDRAALGERAGYQHSTRDLYVQRLQRRQLVTTARGQVAASETLF